MKLKYEDVLRATLASRREADFVLACTKLSRIGMVRLHGQSRSAVAGAQKPRPSDTSSVNVTVHAHVCLRAVWGCWYAGVLLWYACVVRGSPVSWWRFRFSVVARVGPV